MSSVASVVDGKLNYKTTDTTETGSTNSSEPSSSLDKDAFLQLLVAQMKYQDPLQPTDNTEYISQFTAFSELEAIQNMSSSMDLQRASGLVGQYVLLKTTSETTGEESSTMGKVDYIYYEGSKAYLSVNGQDYSLDDLDTVIDEQYFNASQLANSFAESYTKLPSIANLTTGYQDVITNLREVYNDMSDYEKSFVPDSYISGLSSYEDRLSALINQEEAAKSQAEASDEGTQEPDSGEDDENGTGMADGVD